MRKLFILTLALCVSIGIWAQTKTFSGVVVNQSNEPIIGATVVIEGTSQGTITDFDGKFSINAKPTDILVISFIGYDNLKISANDPAISRIKLKESNTGLDEVMIVGYRNSLSKAIDIKKSTINATDAIIAEDVAKFPQSNLAEALQRVSGIQIVRDDAGGVGNQVSIRGMSPEYTQVTINGSSVANASSGESYNFNTMPAEIFSRIEVSKAPTAKMTEGGVGGSIDLVMRKPFELEEQTFVVSAEAQTNTQQQMGVKLTPKGSITYGNTWNDKIGIIGSVAYNKFANASEGYDVTRYYEESYDLDGDGVNEYENIRVPRPRYVSQGQEVERLSANLSAQYKFSENMDLVVSGLWSQNKQTETRYTPIWFMPGDNPTEIITDGAFVEFIEFESVDAKLEDQIQENLTNSYQTNLDFNWFLQNDWKLNAKAVYSLNTSDEERFRYYSVNTNTASYSVIDNLKYFDLQTPTNFSDASEFTMDEARHYIWDSNDEIISGKLDLSKRFNNKFSIDFGGSTESRTKDREYYYNRNRNIGEDFAPVGQLLTGFMDNVSEAGGLNEFYVHDFDKAYEQFGSKVDMSEAREIDAYYDINQLVNSGYFMADYKINKFKANVGVRYAHTTITSKGYDVNDETEAYTEIERKNSYGDFLPSAHLSYEPFSKFFVKASFARVMTRPRIQDLSSYQVVDDVNNKISAKNPELDPFRANQYDVSFEWYPREEILLSAGLFRKDIESFITDQTRIIEYNGEDYELRQPVNGNNAVVQGVELNYQQPFTFLPSPFDGLGVAANYTLSLSDFTEIVEGTEETYEMPNNSKHSYNVIGYYEKYGFGIRLAYNYRSSYLREKPVPEDGLKYRAGIGQADISASYDFKHGITLTANVLNAFNAKKYEYIWEEKYMDNTSIFGTTVQVGLRVKF